jgi:large subunit ribosomal protein L4
MPTLATKTNTGASGAGVSVSEKVFAAPRNIALMHQAVKAEMENRRQDTRNAPGRGDMLGGGKKPWRQKGTGRARQGSAVAPHWRKGGAAHGPHPRVLGHALPRKMRRAAICAALSAKLADGEFVVLDGFGLSEISTKEAVKVLQSVTGGAKKSLVILDEADPTVVKSMRNLPGVVIRIAPGVSTRDIIDGGIVVATKAAVLKMDATWGGEEAVNA